MLLSFFYSTNAKTHYSNIKYQKKTEIIPCLREMCTDFVARGFLDHSSYVLQMPVPHFQESVQFGF